MLKRFAFGLIGFLAGSSLQATAAPVLTSLGSAHSITGHSVPLVITTTNGVTTGHTILLAICSRSNTATITSVADTAINTYTTLVATFLCATVNGHGFLYKVQNPTGEIAGSTITITTSLDAVIGACAATIDGTTTVPPTADTVGTVLQGNAWSTGAMSTPYAGITLTGSSPYLLIGFVLTSEDSATDSWSEDTTHGWSTGCSLATGFQTPGINIGYQTTSSASPVVYSPTLGTLNTGGYGANEIGFDTGSGAAVVHGLSTIGSGK